MCSFLFFFFFLSLMVCFFFRVFFFCVFFFSSLSRVIEVDDFAKGFFFLSLFVVYLSFLVFHDLFGGFVLWGVMFCFCFSDFF